MEFDVLILRKNSEDTFSEFVVSPAVGSIQYFDANKLPSVSSGLTYTPGGGFKVGVISSSTLTDMFRVGIPTVGGINEGIAVRGCIKFGEISSQMDIPMAFLDMTNTSSIYPNGPIVMILPSGGMLGTPYQRAVEFDGTRLYITPDVVQNPLRQTVAYLSDVPSASGFVPYIGANSNLALGNYSLSAANYSNAGNTYTITVAGSTTNWVRIARVPLSTTDKNVIVKIKAYIANGTITEGIVNISIAHRAADTTNIAADMVGIFSHSYYSFTTAANGVVLYQTRISYDATHWNLDVQKYKTEAITIESTPLHTNSWEWLTGAQADTAAAGTASRAMVTYRGVYSTNLIATSANSASYSSRGEWVGITTLNSSDKTGQWMYIGNVTMSYNGSYLGEKSINFEVALKEMTSNLTARPIGSYNDVILRIKCHLAAHATSAIFNSNVPTIAIEALGEYDFDPATNLAILVYSTSTSTKVMRFYIKLQSANQTYSVLMRDGYGIDFTTVNTGAGAAYTSGGVATGQAIAASLPTPAQGSVVYGVDSRYARRGHSHDSLYASVSHNHDSVYASVSHNHDSAYAAASHNHDSAYASASHNHDSSYAAATHSHSDLVPYTGANSALNLGNNNLVVNTNTLFVNSAQGKVGIGTASPSYLLHVSGGNTAAPTAIFTSTNATWGTQFILDSSGAGGREYRIYSTGSANALGGGRVGIYDATASAYRLIMTPAGYLGLGATNPLCNLHIVAAAGGAGVYSPLMITGPGMTLSLNAGQYSGYGGFGLGAYWNGSNWIAGDSAPANFHKTPTQFTITGDTGKTVGNSFSPTTRVAVDLATGRTGIMVAAPTAMLHLPASTASASTAPLKLNAGVLMTNAEAGAIEWDGTSLYITQVSGPTRKKIGYDLGLDDISQNKLLGRYSAGSGIYEQLSLGTLLQVTQGVVRKTRQVQTQQGAPSEYIAEDALSFSATITSTTVNSLTQDVHMMHNLVKCPNTGKLYHFWYASQSHSSNYGQILIRHSFDSGRTWSTPTEVAYDGGNALDCGNPSGGFTSDGRLIIFYVKRKTSGNSWERPQGLFYKYSDDGGVTWSSELALTTMETHASTGKRIASLTDNGYYFWSYSPHGPLIDDGEYLYQTYYNYGNNNTTDATYTCKKVVIARSSDNGLTWDDDWNQALFMVGLSAFDGTASYTGMPSEPLMFKGVLGEYFMIIRSDALDNEGIPNPILMRTKGGLRSSAGFGNWGIESYGVTFDNTTQKFTQTGTHKITDGDFVVITGTTLPTGYLANRAYYAKKNGDNTISLYQDANFATPTAFTTNGSGLTLKVVANFLKLNHIDDVNTSYNTTALYRNYQITGGVFDSLGSRLFMISYAARFAGKQAIAIADVYKLCIEPKGEYKFFQGSFRNVGTYAQGINKSHGNADVFIFDDGSSITYVAQETSSSLTSAHQFSLPPQVFTSWVNQSSGNLTPFMVLRQKDYPTSDGNNYGYVTLYLQNDTSVVDHIKSGGLIAFKVMGEITAKLIIHITIKDMYGNSISGLSNIELFSDMGENNVTALLEGRWYVIYYWDQTFIAINNTINL